MFTETTQDAGERTLGGGCAARRAFGLATESGNRLSTQEGGDLELVILDRRRPGRRSSMRIQLALRRAGRPRALRRTAVFRMERGAARLDRRGKRAWERRRSRIFLAADAEGGELFE